MSAITLEPFSPLPRRGRHRRPRRCGQTQLLRDWLPCTRVAVGLVPAQDARRFGLRDRAVCMEHHRHLEAGS